MASRRMFSEKIVESDAFIDLSLPAQSLYFHLCMNADDDGFIGSPNKIIRMIGTEKKHYNELLEKRFILSFESGICAIKHWKISNLIQKDRYNETVYREEKNMIIVKDNKSYTLRDKNDNKMDTSCEQNANNLETQYSIGKNSIDKDRKEKNIIPPKSEWVSAFCKERNNGIEADEFINFYESKGWLVGKSKMKDWQASIRVWEKNRNIKVNENKPVEKNEHEEVKSRYSYISEEEQKYFFDIGAFCIEPDEEDPSVMLECVDYGKLTEKERLYLQEKGVI